MDTPHIEELSPDQIAELQSLMGDQPSEEDLYRAIGPLAWPDVCFWHFSGFVASLSDDITHTMPPSAMWSLVLEPPTPPVAAKARPYWLTILANVVASVGCSHDLLMPQALREISRRVPAFAEAMPDNRSGFDATLSNDLAYLAVEIALAHEVGHVFSGDHHHVLKDPDERQADLLAHGAFVNSAGWRTWCLERSGLGDLGKISVGLLAFGEAMRTLVTVRALAAEHLLDPQLGCRLMDPTGQVVATGKDSVTTVASLNHDVLTGTDTSGALAPQANVQQLQGQVQAGAAVVQQFGS